MRLLRNTLCVLCVAHAGCAGGLASGSGGWLQVDTKDVRLRTDLDPSVAREFATDLQRHRDALVDSSFECASAQLMQPLRITFFANEEEFDAVANPDAQTLLEPSRVDIVDMPPELLMKPTNNEKLLRQAALHEMVRTLAADCYPGLPPWLSEGLPAFYETVELEGNALVAGRPRYTFVQQSQMANERARERQEVIIVPHTAVPTLQEVLSSGFDEFFQYIDYYDTLVERDRLLLLGRYAGAWALTHSLFTVDVTTYARLQQFMAELRFGETPNQAWQSTMTGIDLEPLYADWTAVNVRYPLIAIGLDGADEVTTSERAMSENEVELHLAARWNWADEKERAAATTHVDRAIELEPGAPEAYLMRAALADASGARDDAAAWLAQAAKVAPNDPRVLRGQLVFLIAEGDRVDRGPELSELVLELEERAMTAGQFDALSRYYLDAADDTMMARYWAARALRRDPGCAPCRVTAADALAAAGQPALAASMYKRALNVGAHDRALDRDYIKHALREVGSSSP